MGKLVRKHYLASNLVGKLVSKLVGKLVGQLESKDYLVGKLVDNR